MSILYQCNRQVQDGDCTVLFQLKQPYCYRGGVRKGYLFLLRAQIFIWLRGSDGRTMSTQGEWYQVKRPGDVLGPQQLAMEPETAMLFCNCQNTAGSSQNWASRLWTLAIWQQLSKISLHLWEQLSDQCLQAGLLQSMAQVESRKQQQPGYLLCDTGFLLPLNCSVMWSLLCHHLHHYLHPMGQDKASVNNRSVSYLHYPLNSYCFSLHRCSHWLNSRCPFPPPTEYGCSRD